MYRHTCESILSPSVFKAYVWASALIEWCSSVVNEPRWLHSMFVLKRPAVKNIAEHSCDIFSFTFNDLIWILKLDILISFHSSNKEKLAKYLNELLTYSVRIKQLASPVDILMCHFDNLDRIGWIASGLSAQLAIDSQFQCKAECVGQLHMRFQILPAFPCHLS